MITSRVKEEVESGRKSERGKGLRGRLREGKRQGGGRGKKEVGRGVGKRLEGGRGKKEVRRGKERGREGGRKGVARGEGEG